MGYTTEFEGRFNFDRKLTVDEHNALLLFADERHGDNLNHDPQYPGFYCQWVPTDDDMGLEWDGNEKFYSYVEWLQVIINDFLIPWGIKMNGLVKWRGESFTDLGVISVEDNVISVAKAGR